MQPGSLFTPFLRRWWPRPEAVTLLEVFVSECVDARDKINEGEENHGTEKFTKTPWELRKRTKGC